jgi:hypothetical protein
MFLIYYQGISPGIVGNVVSMAAEEDDFADFQSATAPAQNTGINR